MSKKPNLKSMAKGNNAVLQALRREQEYTRQYTPYVLALFCLTLKHNTDLSNEDIEHIVDCFQDEAQSSVGMNATLKQCAEETGLDLYAEPNKAKISR